MKAALLSALVLGALSGASVLADCPEDEFLRGNFAAAAELASATLKSEPENAEAGLWLLRSLFELRDYDGAAREGRALVAKEPGSSQDHLWLGRALGRKAERSGWWSGFSLAKAARHEFEEAVSIDPGNLEAERDLIRYYSRAPGIVGGGDEKALRQIAVLAGIDPAEAHLARADVLRRKGKSAEAEYREALAARPHDLDAFFEAAEYAAETGNARLLETSIAGAAALAGSDPRLGYYRGVADVLGGSPLAGVRRLKVYLATTPDRSDWPSHDSVRAWLSRADGMGSAEARRSASPRPD
jgi:tetratricopeptide (TPR) repeat protein